jgi:A/G-specific adenine glycosylase
MTTPYKSTARSLLAWRPGHRDHLPWRRTRDPYRILVSEVMLQQTQVSTVTPYFRRFIRKFPTLSSLARAPVQRVLKVWEGLGYYARARNLHRLAQEVIQRNGGQLPASYEEWLRLPGIGEYTAGAMASFAFGQDVPALDGNTIRVIVRLFGIRKDPSEGPVRKKLFSLAQRLIPFGEGRRMNLALMDLGATVCLPRDPRCAACPVMRFCVAKGEGIQDRLPLRRRRKPIPTVEAVIGVISKKGKVLIAKRPAKGLLGGLWEFPGGKPEPGESLSEALGREIREETGIRVVVRKPLLVVRHAYSHFRIRLHAFSCTYESGAPNPLGCVDLKWVSPTQLRTYPFPKANQIIIAHLLNPLKIKPFRSENV